MIFFLLCPTKAQTDVTREHMQKAFYAFERQAYEGMMQHQSQLDVAIEFKSDTVCAVCQLVSLCAVSFTQKRRKKREKKERLRLKR